MFLHNPLIAVPEDRAMAAGEGRIGDIRYLFDSNGLESVVQYIYGAAALTVGIPYTINYGGAEAQRIYSGVPATIGTASIAVAAAYATTTAAGVAWVTRFGKQVDAVTSGTVADTDQVEVLNAGVAFVCDGTSGSTTFTVRSVGAALEAAVGNVADLFLNGLENRVVAAT